MFNPADPRDQDHAAELHAAVDEARKALRWAWDHGVRGDVLRAKEELKQAEADYRAFTGKEV